MLGQVLMETFLGALTGYLTNDVAIKGLFKKGGVVEKTRSDFIHEASKLLEDEIITEEVLRERLQLDSVKVAIDDLLRNYFSEQVPYHLKNKYLKDNENFSLHWEQWQNVLWAIWKQQKEEFFDILFADDSWKAIFSENQLDLIGQRILQIIAETLKEGRYLENYLNAWLQDDKDLTWAQLGLADVADKAAEKIKLFLPEILLLLKENYSDQLLGLLEHYYQALNVSGLLEALEDILKKRNISEFLLVTPKGLNQWLISALNSEQAEAWLNDWLEHLLALVGTLNIPLKQLLPAQGAVILVPFLQKELPNLVETLNLWLKTNQELLNTMIDEAVAEVLGSKDGLKGFILQIVQETILSDVANEYRIVDKVGDFLKESASEKGVETIVEKIDQWLENTTVADVVINLDNETIKRILRYVLKVNMEDYLNSYGPALIEKFLARPLGYYWTQESAAKLGRKLPEMICRYLLDDLTNDEGLAKLSNAISKLEYRFLNSSVTSWIKKIDSEALQDKLIKQIQQADTSFIYQWADTAFLEQQLPLWSDYALKSVDWQEKIENLDLGKLWENIFQQEQVDHLLPLINEKLNQEILKLLSGKLSAMAEKSLNQLSNDEILKLVEDFMGRELKPLNYLGAALGSIVGLAAGIILAGPLGGITATTPAALGGVILGKSFVFGAVGYGTNCAAIKGLFWPYRPLGGIKALQGVIPKQQEGFARSMGNMVNDYVMNDGIMKQQLLLYHDTLLETAIEWFNDEIERSINYVEKDFAYGSLNWLRNQGSLDSRLSPIGNQSLRFLENISLSIEKVGTPLEVLLCNSANRFCQSQQELARLFIKGKKNLLEQMPFSWLKIDYQQLALHWDAAYQEWQQKSIGTIIGEKQGQSINEALENRLLNFVSGEKIGELLGGILQQDLMGTAIGELFDGKVNDWFINNAERILELIYEELLKYLEGRQEALTEMVQKAIKNKLSFMQLMGYAAMGGDSLVRKVVERIITVKLPLFLKLKQDEIETVLIKFWHEHLAVLSLEQIGLASAEQLSDSISRLLANEKVQSLLTSGLKELLDRLYQQPCVSFLNKTILKTLPLAVDALTLERKLADQWLAHHWQLMQKDLLDDTLSFVTKVMVQWSEGRTVADVLGDCTLVSWQKVHWNLLWQDENGVCVVSFMNDILKRAAKIPLEQWIDWSAACDIIESTFKSLLKNEQLAVWWQKSVHLLLTEIVEGKLLICDKNQKEQPIQWLLEALWQSIYNQGAAILNEMNLAQVTTVQVQAMAPKKLEELVWGFASQYLVHIQNMGWLGAGFALAGIVLTWLLW